MADMAWISNPAPVGHRKGLIEWVPNLISLKGCVAPIYLRDNEKAAAFFRSYDPDHPKCNPVTQSIKERMFKYYQKGKWSLVVTFSY